ncbi:MAG: 3-dehydroquinate synthase [Burkholderiales bacterium]
MEILNIDIGRNNYSVYIERGLIRDVPEFLKLKYPNSRFAVITDTNVRDIYGNKLSAGLDAAGIKHNVIALPPGESTKSLKNFSHIQSRLAQLEYTRTDLIIALGGGVVGDLAGFAASAYLRGIRYVQIPTTLLAQVDSSVGGKTAVNIPEGKNLVGAFHHPDAVYIDPDVLATLGGEDFAGGMAEVIKYGFIKDKAILETLEEEYITAHSPELGALVKRCLEIKRDLVEADEKDRGERMLLNFGHTIGHALERVCAKGGRRITHGQAVARGMASITKASERMGQTKLGTAAYIIHLLHKYGLPCCLGGFDTQQILEGIFVDKKNINGKLNLVLLREPGVSFIHPIDKNGMAEYIAPKSLPAFIGADVRDGV